MMLKAPQYTANLSGTINRWYLSQILFISSLSTIKGKKVKKKEGEEEEKKDTTHLGECVCQDGWQRSGRGDRGDE